MISTLEPPASIRRLVDGRLGVYPVLCIPWGEEAASGHGHAGLVYSRGGVHQPRDPERLSVNFDHENDDAAGCGCWTASDETGLWCAVKFGHRAQSLIDRGRVTVSAEVDAAGFLEGVALRWA